MIAIRRATPSDCDALDALDRTQWGPESTPADLPFSSGGFGSQIPLDDVFVATDQDVVVAYVAIGPRTPLRSNAHVGRIRSICVHRDHRRSGIARRLLATAMDEGRERGWEKLALRAMASNSTALRLYAAMGFVEEGRFRGEFRIGGALVDDLVLARWL